MKFVQTLSQLKNYHSIKFNLLTFLAFKTEIRFASSNSYHEKFWACTKNLSHHLVLKQTFNFYNLVTLFKSHYTNLENDHSLIYLFACNYLWIERLKISHAILMLFWTQSGTSACWLTGMPWIWQFSSSWWSWLICQFRNWLLGGFIIKMRHCWVKMML